MKLENTVLCEIRQTKKNKDSMVSHIWRLKEKSLTHANREIGGFQGPGRGWKKWGDVFQRV